MARYDSVSRYLIELRRCILRSVCLMTLMVLALLPFSNQLYFGLALPLLHSLHANSQLIATSLTSSFIAPLKLTMMVSVFLTIPFFLSQLWFFVAPALYPHEKRWIRYLLIASIFLFYSGMLFAYFVIFPILFHFFVQLAPEGVVIMPDINQYLDLALQLFIAFGCAFEVPVIVVFLTRGGWVSIQTLVEKRPYFIVGAFVAAMLIGPPDVGSQLLLAIPLCLLFEAGIFVAKWLPYENPPTAE
jgi:sec-independent protein translocase protein TatC